MIVFKNWLSLLNKRMKTKNKKNLLLVDNATEHNVSSDVLATLTHIKIEYLPPNTTSVLQPADVGVIRNFKLFYTEFLTRFYVEQVIRISANYNIIFLISYIRY